MSTPALRLPATLENFVADPVELGAHRSREAAIVAAVAGEERRAQTPSRWLMARAIELSESALTDFDGIYDFIAKHNTRAAAKVLRNLDVAIQRLANQPRLG